MTMTHTPLTKPQRTQLENTVKTARDLAEKAAEAVLSQLAVGEGKAPDYLGEAQKALRRRLRAHGRSLGDLKTSGDRQDVQHLVWEVAYEHWHRMLFARFLAENGLLLWEPGAALSLSDCEAMVQDADPLMNLGAKSQWEFAGKLAARMLPEVFKPQSPVFELVFAPEHQRDLERLLGGLPPEVFTASDSLGWVYQFWQARRKDAINASEVKIGADELPAVTQLFTEPYMVDFLLHNSLGAWWVTRYPDMPCPVTLSYLRLVSSPSPQPSPTGGEGELVPAAGEFKGWPDHLKDFKLLDPCCGSGHFLVAALLLLVPMRMAAEGLDAKAAVDAVLADNLHGLELDARCVEIAVFALALTAWRYPDEYGNPLGVRAEMPAPKIACCGLKVAASPEDWAALVPDEADDVDYLRQELRLLHSSFKRAPLLGSLLDPSRTLKNDLLSHDFERIRELLERALATEQPAGLKGQGDLPDDRWDLALTARGLLDAARLLDERYHLVITNVPYLARGKQNDTLKAYCETHYPDAKNDLANVFLERCLELTKEGTGGKGAGVVQIVMPQNWLFLSSYKKQRIALLERVEWNLLARLGEGGFDSPQAAGAFTILLTQTRIPVSENSVLRGIDATGARTAPGKASLLREECLVAVKQQLQISNPDSTIIFSVVPDFPPISNWANIYYGSKPGQTARVTRQFWEMCLFGEHWMFMESTPEGKVAVSGKSEVCYSIQEIARQRIDEFGIRGKDAWGRRGIIFSKMRELPSAIYLGHFFDDNTYVLLPRDERHVELFWLYTQSSEFNNQLRIFNQKLNVTRELVESIPFDFNKWDKIRASTSLGIEHELVCDDPTQWLFHGHPQPATDPLQVAVARLLGYHWPAETDKEMELSIEAHAWIDQCESLAGYVDDDGIVCLPSVRGEPPAHERLLQLLMAAWDDSGTGWRPAVLDKLLADVDCAGKDLEIWLRDNFFEQHAKRFHHRPFIWHVWDGLKDGFAALVNYHKLDTKNLERLVHTYLGDWIRQQEQGTNEGIDGAETRLAAARNLKQRLELILEGEPPYDIFVRWKPLAEQPIGWNPDLNDGVRLNIRPFMTAEVLRHNKKPKLNISWDKDRGKDVESAPWFALFEGNRINDHHLTVAEKKMARLKQEEAHEN